MAATTEARGSRTDPAVPHAPSRMRRRWLGRGARHLASIIIAVIFLIPLFWMLSGSLKSNADIFRFPPSLWPAHPQWSNYPKALIYIPFWHYLANSTIVAACTVAGSGTPAAASTASATWLAPASSR